MKLKFEYRRGVVLIWVAILMLVFAGFLGLSIDMGFMVWTAQKMQVGADAAALAGAHEIRNDIVVARQAAVDIGAANTAAADPILIQPNVGNAIGGEVVVGVFNRGTRTFTPTEDAPNAVRVTTRRNAASLGGSVDRLFGSGFGFPTFDVERTAIAMIHGGLGAGVIALNETEQCGFDVRGTAGVLSVDGGVIYVNSNHDNGACHAGKPTIEAAEIYVSGEADKNWDKQVNYDGEVIPGATPIPDPLYPLPEPFYDVAADKGTVWIDGGLITNETPGYFSGGITVRNGSLTLAPGVYILDGAGLDVNGGDLIGPGVTFYIIGTGYVDIRGNGIIDLTHPDEDLYGPYPASPDISSYEEFGVIFFQAYDNTNPSRILGTATVNIDGVYYFPDAHLEIGGTSDNFGTGLIADTIEAHGDGLLQINYEDQFGILPRNVFLVE